MDTCLTVALRCSQAGTGMYLEYIQGVHLADMCNKIGRSLADRGRHDEAFHLFCRAFVAVKGACQVIFPL